jgi:hypothetical protein
MSDKLKQIETICAEIAMMHYEGKVRAIAAVIVTESGHLRTLTAYSEGTKLPLIAGASILQHEMVCCAQASAGDPAVDTSA